MINETYKSMLSGKSVIRELNEYANDITRHPHLKPEDIFDYSLGNPSVPVPEAFNARIKALLDSGAALGRGNGPLLVRRAGDRSPIRRVAVPGVHTTANALMMRLFPRITERTPLLFSQIAAAVERGDFDAGVLIHEGRFVYRQRQLELVADLGQLWEQTTALPLPLGGIAAKRSLPEAVRRQVETLIRQSIEYAFAHPEASRAYIKEHAQELDDAVIDAHIALFVNDYSLSLGDEGRRAVEALTGIACAFNS